MIRTLALAFLLLGAGAANAQSTIPTLNNSVLITTGLTFQQILPTANARPPTPRNALELQNNQTTTDNCWINYDGTVTAGMTTSSTVTVNGVSMTAAQASVLLTPGQAYTRYYPHTPSGIVVGTCASTSDSIYAAVE